MKVPFAREKSSPQKTFDKTLAEYQDAAAKNPDDIRIHIKIAELYLKNNNRDKAINEYLYAANTYRDKKLYQIAISIYTHILSVDPGQTAVYFTLADLHQKNGFNGDAVAALEKLAAYYQKAGLPGKAADTINKILEIDPANQQFREKVNKFLAGAEAQITDAAVTQLPGSALPAEKPTSGFFDLEAALGSDSSLDLSAAAGDDGDAAASDGAAGKQPFDEIFDQLKSEAEATPDETAPDLYYDMGLAQQRLGEFAEAVKEFELAIACNQKVAQSYLKMAVCYRTMNNLDKAAAAIKQALALDFLTEDDKKELREEQKNIRTAGGGAGGLLGFFKRLRS